MSEAWRNTYDAWKLSGPPEDDETDEDDEDGHDEPDPDEAYDRMRDQEAMDAP